MDEKLIEQLMRETQTEGFPQDVKRLVDKVQAIERERCAVIAWSHFMRVCIERGLSPAYWDFLCSAGAIREKSD
jgi:hypothetical protein